jgi:hypothetical protein
LNQVSISEIHQKKIKWTSRTEASVTTPEVSSCSTSEVMETKENSMLTQLKQEIKEAQYACELMKEIEGRLKEASLRLKLQDNSE